jgi:hypothetical protein
VGNARRAAFNAKERVALGVFPQAGVDRGEEVRAEPWAPLDMVAHVPVVIHDCRFSPNNAMVRLQPRMDYHIFFVLAALPGRCCVSWHIVAGRNAEINDALRKAAAEVHSVGCLVHNLHSHSRLTVVANELRGLLEVA